MTCFTSEHFLSLCTAAPASRSVASAHWEPRRSYSQREQTSDIDLRCPLLHWPGELTTLPSFFLSTKLRVYSDAFGEKEALANGFFSRLPDIDSTNILASDPAAPQSASPSWHCLPPGGVVWLWFAGCQSFVLEGSEKKGNAFSTRHNG